MYIAPSQSQEFKENHTNMIALLNLLPDSLEKQQAIARLEEGYFWSRRAISQSFKPEKQ